MFGNVFSGESFSNIEMTNASVQLPKQPSGLETLINWQSSTCLTPEVAIDQEAGIVRVVASTARNGVAPLRRRSRRATAKIAIPGYSERDTILNSSLLGIRETGSNTLKTIEGERNKALAAMDADLDATHEHQRAKAITGIVEDIDGTVLADLYEILGEEQREVDLDLSLPQKDIDDQLIEIKQISERQLKGIRPERYLLLQGNDDSNATLRQKAVKEQAQNPMNVMLQRQDNRSGVRIVNDVDIVYYGGNRLYDDKGIDQGGYIPDDESYFIPIFPGCARTIWGPSEVEEFWGNILPRYVTRELIKHGKGVEMEMWMYVINFFTRPGANLKVNIK